MWHVTSEKQLSSRMLSLKEIYASVDGSLYERHPHKKKITKEVPTKKREMSEESL